MAEVKIKSQLPPNEHANGLIDLIAELVASPRTRRLLIVLADAPEQKVMHCTDPESGEAWTEIAPTLHVRAVEQVTSDDLTEAHLMLARARETRQARARNLALSLFTGRD